MEVSGSIVAGTAAILPAVMVSIVTFDLGWAPVFRQDAAAAKQYKNNKGLFIVLNKHNFGHLKRFFH